MSDNGNLKVALTLSMLIGLPLRATESAAQEFSCPPVRPSAVLAPAYGRASNPMVCEGFYDRNVSGKFIELVSVLSQPPSSLRTVLQPDLPLQFTPRVAPTVPFALHVQPLSIATLYRADAQLEGNGLTWNPRPMLEATRLQLKDFAFLATSAPTRKKEMVVLPIRIGDRSVSAQSVYVTLRVSTKTLSIKWRAYPTHGSGDRSKDRDLTWRDALQPQAPVYPLAWTTFEVPLAPNLASTTLEIKATDESNKPLNPLRIVVVGNDYATR